MADTANLSKEERTLQALLRALKNCLVRPRERAEKIACLDLDNYRGFRRDPDEDENFMI
jgi:hypothetical protein